MFLLAETPIHAGSGSSVEFIDLPIQREVFTDLPVIHGQSLKGAIREHLYHLSKTQNSNINKDDINLIFGAEDSDYAGAISITQARVLAFPIASLRGVFVYATSPLVLSLFRRDLEKLDPQKAEKISNIPNIKFNEALVTNKESVVVNSQVILSQFCFNANITDDTIRDTKDIANTLAEMIFTQPTSKSNQKNNNDYWKQLFINNFVILNDTTFKHLTRIKTELVYRTAIDYEKGVVKTGGLWTEEFLPPETIMWCNIYASDPHNGKNKNLKEAKDIANFLLNNNITYINVGGDQSIGKGFVRLSYLTS